ncbi:hypothetical protein [Treponema sp.]
MAETFCTSFTQDKFFAEYAKPIFNQSAAVAQSFKSVYDKE